MRVGHPVSSLGRINMDSLVIKGVVVIAADAALWLCIGFVLGVKVF